MYSSVSQSCGLTEGISLHAHPKFTSYTQAPHLPQLFLTYEHKRLCSHALTNLCGNIKNFSAYYHVTDVYN